MSEVQSLIAEAKHLLADAETEVKDVAEHVDPTQLRVAVHRLELFREHVGQVVADRPKTQESQEPEADVVDELEALTRKDLNAKATELGVDAPDKLANKQAVIDAIRVAEQASDGEE